MPLDKEYTSLDRFVTFVRIPIETLVIVTSAATIFLCFFLPIYTDEICWKFLQARYFHDAGRAITWSPQCSSFYKPDSFAFLPFRLWSALIYGDLINVYKLRSLGVASFVGWIGFLCFVVWRRFRLQVKLLTLVTILLSISCLGVLPFLLVMNRPEQLLLWGLSICMAAPLFNSNPHLKRPLVQFAIVLAYLLGWSIMVSNHPKAFMFFPLVLASGYLLIHSNKLRLATLFGASIISISLFYFWQGQLACPEFPDLQAVSDHEVIKPGQLIHEPVVAMKAGIRNIFSVTDFFAISNFSSVYPENWLPPVRLGSTGKRAHFLVNLFELILGSLAVVLSLLMVGREIVRLKLSPEGVITLGGLISIFIYSFLSTKKAFYASALFIPILFMLLIYSIPLTSLRKFRNLAIVLIALLFATSLMSQITLAKLFWPEAHAHWATSDELPSQALSISAFKYSEQIPLILAAAEKCGIHPTGTKKHVVIDDYTYPVFMGLAEPYHVYYLKNFAARFSDPDLFRYLSKYKSDGLIARCEFLPEDLSKQAIRSGRYCCLPAFYQ